MPIYEYECTVCGRFEAIQKPGETSLSACPHGRTDCPIGRDASSVKRLISPSAFHLKGSGWYKTDYSSGGASAGGGGESSGSSSEGGSSGDSSSSSSGGDSSGGDGKKSGGCGSSCACH